MGYWSILFLYQWSWSKNTKGFLTWGLCWGRWEESSSHNGNRHGSWDVSHGRGREGGALSLPGCTTLQYSLVSVPDASGCPPNPSPGCSHDASTQEKGSRETSAVWEEVQEKPVGEKVYWAESGRPGIGPGLRQWWSRGHRPWAPPPSQRDCNQPKSLSAFNRAGENMQSANCMSKIANQDNTNNRKGKVGKKNNPQQASPSLHLMTRGTMCGGSQTSPKSPNGCAWDARAGELRVSRHQPFNQSVLLVISPHVF